MHANKPPAFTPELLLAAYSRGAFPMVHDDGKLHWHDPDPRAIFPLAHIAPNARLQRSVRSNGYQCTIDRCFTDVMRACAARESTWITEEMITVYTWLHEHGHAHSVETWQDGALIGGIYGVSIGSVFFGESMFSRATNASKAAFHHLATHLRQQGFVLFDSQYANNHTRSLGVVEIPRSVFRDILRSAIEQKTEF